MPMRLDGRRILVVVLTSYFIFGVDVGLLFLVESMFMFTVEPQLEAVFKKTGKVNSTKSVSAHVSTLEGCE